MSKRKNWQKGPPKLDLGLILKSHMSPKERTLVEGSTIVVALSEEKVEKKNFIEHSKDKEDF